MNKFSALKSKIYSYLTDYNNEDKKKPKAQKCVVKILNLKIINIV